MVGLSQRSGYHRVDSRRTTFTNGNIRRMTFKNGDVMKLQYNKSTQGCTVSIFLPILLDNNTVKGIKHNTIYNDKVTILCNTMCDICVYLYILGCIEVG